MALYRTVYVICRDFGRHPGWAVERTSFPDPTVIVSRVYRSVSEADLERKRLCRLEDRFHHA